MRHPGPRHHVGRRPRLDPLETKVLPASTTGFDPSTAGYVANLYMALLQQTATSANIAYYDQILRQPDGVQVVFNDIAALPAHQTLLDILGVTSSTSSPTGTVASASGLTTNEAYVVNLYQTLTQTSPTIAQLDEYVGLLDSGTAPIDLLEEIAALPASQTLLGNNTSSSSS